MTVIIQQMSKLSQTLKIRLEEKLIKKTLMKNR